MEYAGGDGYQSGDIFGADESELSDPCSLSMMDLTRRTSTQDVISGTHQAEKQALKS